MSYLQTLGAIALTLLGAYGLIKAVTLIATIIVDLYYFTVAVPRFRRNLDVGQRARLLHSDVPVSISSVGDECAMILIPTPNGTISQSVTIDSLYPL